MSGGAYEYVMGGMYTSDKTKIIIEDSEFSDEELTIGDDAFLGHKYINIIIIEKMMIMAAAN